MHLFDRALILHRNGFGWLGIKHVSWRNEQATKDPDLMVPSTYSATGSISLPELSNSLEMLKTASDMAHEMNTDASAKCNPGPVICMFNTKVIFGSASSHIRLPNPKQAFVGSASCFRPVKRSGLNSSGREYTRESCRICLKNVHLASDAPSGWLCTKS